ncbi:hypothetical protein I4O68_11870 [Enterobacter hormaechei]|uniref:hypothetical protein n=1 Tax=Enterobacter hormaechei TaxID=158836 RepID=UPI00079C97F8|nr:hypothetical protein [Enterobacter hormaechei]ELC6295505.1 hypothetical protein [Enterobacter hormaechei]ELC6541256.1 hypothetical protein [Enterobacter hormaechei]MBG0545202.1 hypothetical protein [Enterobacter hormaechei]MCM7630284.1 hypothetical protein [Enterobacter hormaechei]CZW49119.1 Uncharacterised protein [Enterobacter hormaechei]
MVRVNHTALDGKIAGNLCTLIDEALAQARGQLVAQGWLIADEISLLTDFTPEQFANWKCEHCIFSVHKNGAGEEFPSYALDENLRPLPVMKSILDILTKVKTPWGIAECFATSNDLLAGKMPQEMLSRYPANVIQAAEAEAWQLINGAE